MHHQDAASERHDRPHDMLYQQYRQPAAAVELLQDRDHPVGLGGAKSRHDLIEQKQFRIGGERARQFQALAVRQRESRGSLRALVVEIELALIFTGMCAPVRYKLPMQEAFKNWRAVEMGCR